MKAYDKIN